MGSEDEIGVEVTFTTMQSAGRNSSLDTRRHAFGGPGDWRGGEREAEAGFESALEEREGVGGPNAGRTECFSFLLFFVPFCFRWNGEKEKGEPH